MNPGLKLKQTREKLGLRYRQVEHASNLIAQQRGSQDYVVGLSRLADIENKGVVPSLQRLYSLCAIYRLDVNTVLEWYGFDSDEICRDAALVSPSKTHPIHLAPESAHLPLQFETALDFRHTSYLSTAIRQWGRVPLALFENLDLDRYRYAIIGTEDYFMYPMLRPGALVQIDDRDRRIQDSGWTGEYDRPIYFLELRDGFVCCWCRRTEDYLVLEPHPGSPSPARVLDYKTEVDVIGRVIGAASRMVAAKTGAAPAVKPAARAQSANRTPAELSKAAGA